MKSSLSNDEILVKMISIMEKATEQLKALAAATGTTVEEAEASPAGQVILDKSYEELTVVRIRDFCNTNKRFCTKVLMTLYRQQTSEEQTEGSTKERNFVGFNGLDAAFCTSVAEGVIRYGHMTDKQWFSIRDRMQKYAKQVLDLGFTFCEAEAQVQNFIYPDHLAPYQEWEHENQ